MHYGDSEPTHIEAEKSKNIHRPKNPKPTNSALNLEPPNKTQKLSYIHLQTTTENDGGGDMVDHRILKEETRNGEGNPLSDK